MKRMRRTSIHSSPISRRLRFCSRHSNHRGLFRGIILTPRPTFLSGNSANPLPLRFPYVQGVNASSKSTVHVGTSYEHLCLQVLRRFGFSLTRTGGKSDKGIDLLGLWTPPRPLSTPPLHVIVQCKAYTGQVYPAWIRELEGAFAGAPSDWQDDATIGVLCAPKGATEGIRDAMRKAERGVVWVSVENFEENEGNGKAFQSEMSGNGMSMTGARVTQMLWNQRVRKVVAGGLGAGLRYMPGIKGMEQEVVLNLDGRFWEPDIDKE